MLHNGSVTTRPTDLSIDEYLRERLMPVEGSIPQISGIEMYGNSVPVGKVGGRSVPTTMIAGSRIVAERREANASGTGWPGSRSRRLANGPPPWLTPDGSGEETDERPTWAE